MEEKLITGIIGSTLFVILAIVITILVIIKYYKSKARNNEELFNAIIQAQENERNRVARDIHDSLGGLLGSVKIKLDMMKNLPELQKEEIATDISHASDLIAEAIKEARNASNALMPEAINRFGLKGAINDLVKANKKYFIINLINECPINLEENFQTQIYRLLLELFNNTRKYAQATMVELSIFNSDREVQIIYTDNGIGFNFDMLLNEGKGNGLKNIKFRVEFLKGKMNVENLNGTTYTFRFKN